MKKINLGNSGLMASEIALGCMRINGMEVNDLEAYVHTALECGVDFLTTPIFTAAERARRCLENC